MFEWLGLKTQLMGLLPLVSLLQSPSVAPQSRLHKKKTKRLSYPSFISIFH